jgi:hypothetical protein
MIGKCDVCGEQGNCETIRGVDERGGREVDDRMTVCEHCRPFFEDRSEKRKLTPEQQSAATQALLASMPKPQNWPEGVPWPPQPPSPKPEVRGG